MQKIVWIAFKRRIIEVNLISVIVFSISFTTSALAADPQTIPNQARGRMQSQQQIQSRDTVYGYEIMTPGELADHRHKLRSMKSEQEREYYRAEHHKLMQERAKERGVTLPDTPPGYRRGLRRGVRSGRR